ncbi:hypothetical protein [Shewanella xiamenensis]|uniref:hypothetical protein n=1 Tax=Shewanella xiamenensis TaxID=332186 RepID=UPI001F050F3C|nr:hypothetical protein [Shewanella xiamenensis]UML93042.1 hypothetical protein MKD32_16670 [Shewanella xiamenensis]
MKLTIQLGLVLLGVLLLGAVVYALSMPKRGAVIVGDSDPLSPMPVPYYLNLEEGEYARVMARAHKQYALALCQGEDYWPLPYLAYDNQLLQEVLQNQNEFSQQDYLKSRLALLNERFRFKRERPFLRAELQTLLQRSTAEQSITFSSWLKNRMAKQLEQFQQLDHQLKASQPWWPWADWPSDNHCLQWAKRVKNDDSLSAVPIYLTDNGGGKGIVIDDFFALLLEHQIDQYLARGDVQSAAKVWPQVIRFELLDARIWQDNIIAHIDEYLRFITLFGLDKTEAVAYAEAQLQQIDDIDYYPDDKAIMQRSVQYLRQQAALETQLTDISGKNQHRLRCYQSKAPCLTLWQLYEQSDWPR